ncbi:MAG: DUF3817 domain-containing protein [Bdellovibrio sp.]
MIQAFRVLGWFEGLSFLLLLFVAMPIKYIAGNPEYVKMLGPIHGFLFIGYVLFGNFLAGELQWPLKVRIYSILAAVLPFGTFVFEKKYLNSNTTMPAAE